MCAQMNLIRSFLRFKMPICLEKFQILSSESLQIIILAYLNGNKQNSFKCILRIRAITKQMKHTRTRTRTSIFRHFKLIHLDL